MEVHTQQCQACGCRQVENLLVRTTNQPQNVYVRCVGCGQLVARYELSLYYHHGKGMESFLRSLGPQVAESGRAMLASFETVKQRSVEGFEQVLEHQKQKHADRQSTADPSQTTGPDTGEETTNP